VRLLGLAQYAGEPLPVLDLHAVVEGTTSGSRHRSTVILGRSRRRDRTILGLAVDEVLQVVELPIENMGAADAGVTANSTIEGAEVKVVNTARLLTDTMDDTGAMHG
jgi:chemotaxis signal transduction protein